MAAPMASARLWLTLGNLVLKSCTFHFVACFLEYYSHILCSILWVGDWEQEASFQNVELCKFSVIIIYRNIRGLGLFYILYLIELWEMAWILSITVLLSRKKALLFLESREVNQKISQRGKPLCLLKNIVIILTSLKILF